MVKLIAILAGLLWWVILAAQPVPPSQLNTMRDIGRQHPYMSTSSMLVTQTVTTIYEFKFLRVIELTPTTAETNFAFLRSNTVSISTNVSNTTP